MSTTADSDKLRCIADHIDIEDERSGTDAGSGVASIEAQDFLRGLADRLERPDDPVQLLAGLASSLPTGHPEKPGVLRSIEVLRSSAFLAANSTKETP